MDKVPFDFNQYRKSMKYFSLLAIGSHRKMRYIIPYESDYKIQDSSLLFRKNFQPAGNIAISSLLLQPE
jgi:hypothetical protein